MTDEFALEMQERRARARRGYRGSGFKFELRRVNERGQIIETIPIGEVHAKDYDAAIKRVVADIRSTLKRLQLPGWRIVDTSSGRETPVVASNL